MQGYEEIFIERGKSYHAAMERYPNARVEEFETIVDYVANKSNSSILDLPAGGGYLEKFMPTDSTYLAYDFSREFDDHHSGIKKCKEDKIDLPDASVDVVLSLAALHHVLDKPSFFKEINRVLKSKGQFIIGDVVSGSKVDSFLNVFVNRYNSMGHMGRFITADHDIQELAEAGFKTDFEEKILYWNFEHERDAMAFFMSLFYLDKNPSAKELKKALKQLGYRQETNGYRVKWSLGFLLATKGL